MSNITTLSKNIETLKNEINVLKNKIDDDNTSIKTKREEIIASTYLDLSNKGLDNVKTGTYGSTTSNESGEYNDDDFIIPYYDENGMPTFYINQFSPVYANILTKDKNYMSASGCGPCSWTNAFIDKYEVHSLIDTVGILGYFTKKQMDGQLKSDSIIPILTGQSKENYYKNSFPFVEKYLKDENGNYKFSQSTTNKYDKNNIYNQVEAGVEGNFVIKMDMSSTNLQGLIDLAESNGYEISLTTSGSEGGKSRSVLGSLGDSGHYLDFKYETGENIQVLDSFGNRTVSGEEDISWSGKGRSLAYNLKETSELKLSHETSVVVNTNVNNFETLRRLNGGLYGGGVTVYVSLKKKK